MDIQKNILNYRADIIKDMQEALKIKSVMEEAKEGMPFGEGPTKALKHFLDLGKSFGFEVENFDNYAGHIDFGSGEEMLGVLGHVDVVPEGDGWTHPPYDAIIDNNILYGRGVLDDKGPMIICLYVMKALKDAGFTPKRKIRMILGANEENGSACMRHYFGKLKMPQPTLAFTPDSTFPVTFAEKGIVRVKLSKKIANCDFQLNGGNALNSVPESATFSTSVNLVDTKDIENKIKDFNAGLDYELSVNITGDTLEITSTGKSAHGSKPELGYNAASQLMLFLNELDLENLDLSEFVDFYYDKLNDETNGSSLGIDFHDEDSGNLSLNAGLLKTEKDRLSISLDIRYPVSISEEKVLKTIRAGVAGFDLEVEKLNGMDALYVSKDSPLVTTLMKIYHDITGDSSAEPVAIGGGTYARSVTNGVAFGALLKEQTDNMHQKDEALDLAFLDTLLKIYAEAIYQLSK